MFLHTLSYIFIFFFILFAPSNAFTQNIFTDSLETALTRAKDDSSRIDILIQLSKSFEHIDSAKTWKYYHEVTQLATKSGKEVYIGYSFELAGILYTRSNHKLALDFYSKALNILQKQPQSLRIKRSISSINNNLGIIHYYNGDFESALNYFLFPIKFYENNDPLNPNLGLGYGNISTAYADLGKMQNALVYSSKSFEFAQKLNNKNLLMSAGIAHGSNLLKLKKYKDAFPYLQKAKKIADELKNKYNIYLYYRNIADYFYEEQKYDSSLVNFIRAQPYATKLNSLHDIGFMLLSIGSCYTKMGRYAIAGKNLDSALFLANSNQFKDLQRYVYEALAELSEKKGDYKMAYDFKNRSIQLKDSAYAEDNIKRIEFLEAKYQGEKKQQEVIQLQKDKQIQVLSIKQKSTINYFLISFLSILLIVFFVGFRNFRHRQLLAKQQDELQQQRISQLEKDKQLVAVDSILKGQEEERSRLAKDLHDGLGGLLSGVKFSLSNMKDNLIITPENMAVFERSLDMIDTSIRELRRVAHNMMPEMLTKFGLDEALKEYCNTINATKLITVKYQSHGLTSRIAKSTEIIVYRIIQELLNNTLKHAAASEAFVQLIKEGSRLNVVVEDNGKGFDTSSPEHCKGAGLTNIRSRVEYLKGQLDIHSEKGKGTLVNIEFNV